MSGAPVVPGLETVTFAAAATALRAAVPGIHVHQDPADGIAVHVDAADLEAAARTMSGLGTRLADLFAVQDLGGIVLRLVYALDRGGRYIVVTSPLPRAASTPRFRYRTGRLHRGVRDLRAIRHPANRGKPLNRVLMAPHIEGGFSPPAGRGHAEPARSAPPTTSGDRRSSSRSGRCALSAGNRSSWVLSRPVRRCLTCTSSTGTSIAVSSAGWWGCVPSRRSSSSSARMASRRSETGSPSAMRLRPRPESSRRRRPPVRGRSRSSSSDYDHAAALAMLCQTTVSRSDRPRPRSPGEAAAGEPGHIRPPLPVRRPGRWRRPVASAPALVTALRRLRRAAPGCRCGARHRTRMSTGSRRRSGRSRGRPPAGACRAGGPRLRLRRQLRRDHPHPPYDQLDVGVAVRPVGTSSPERGCSSTRSESSRLSSTWSTAPGRHDAAFLRRGVGARVGGVGPG